jgi:hypothetical protein
MSMLKIEAQAAIKRIDGYLTEIDNLQKLRYRDSRDRKEDLNSQIKNFVKLAFTDSKEKLDTYERSFVGWTPLEWEHPPIDTLEGNVWEGVVDQTTMVFGGWQKNKRKATWMLSTRV